MAPFKALIVEDNANFSRFLCSVLQEKTQCQIVGHASDGLEAIREVEELQPDLVLLDVGLPKMSGIEVSRRIQALSPDIKVIFISQNSSFEIVQAALETGARGYLLKCDAAEILLAVSAVLKGAQFVSSHLHRLYH